MSGLDSKRAARRLAGSFAAAFLSISLCAGVAGAQQQVKEDKEAKFREFSAQVNGYAKLRDAQRSGIPALHKRATAEEIQKHQQALAEKIQEARKDAKAGDIFTKDSQTAFRRVIDKAYSGKHARKIEKTIVQGEPVKLDLFINKPYPARVPITTVPPTLLQRFPRLPKKIEYRVVGNDLVLQDTESRLVIDIFSGAFPDSAPQS